MSHIAEGELTAYADGAYAPEDADAQRIAAHLATCANCRNRLAEEKALSGRAGQILSYAAPQTIEMPAFETLAQSAKPKRAAFPLAWAATVILALGLGWFGRGEFQQPAREERVANVPVAPEQKGVAVASAPTTTVAIAPPPAAPIASGPTRVASAPLRDARLANAARAEGTVAGKADETRRADAGGVIASAEMNSPETAKTVTAQMAAGRALDAAAPASAPPAAPAMHLIPDLMVVSSQQEGAKSVVQQKLPDAKIITVTTEFVTTNFQAEEANRLQAKVAQRRAFVADTFARVIRDGFTVTVSGPLPLDSLRALAKKVK